MRYGKHNAKLTQVAVSRAGLALASMAIAEADIDGANPDPRAG